MTRRISHLVGTLLLCLTIGFASLPAFGSHLRGTSVNWEPTATPGTVQFTIQYSQRTSAGGCNGTCAVGNTISVPFNFGDGASTNVTATITSANSAQDYFSAVGTFTHTYSGSGPYTAFYDVCCRISTIISGENDDLRMETVVYPSQTPINHPPVVSMPAIVTVPLQATTSFNVTATDQDHDVLTYRLATAMEMYNLASFSCVSEEPPGLSISSAGVVTWDTTQITKAGCSFAAPASGDLWTAQFMVEDLDSNNQVKSKTPVDLIIQFISSTETPPTINFSNLGPITVAPGSPVTFSVSADDTTSNSRVTFNASGLPLGATASNTNQALTPPTSSTFSWTPTSSQAGSYVVTYTATNDTFEQIIGSVTINVESISPPVASCPASLSAQYDVPLTIPIQVSDPQGDALSVVWSVDGASVHTDAVTASTGATSLSLSQTFNTLGAHTVSVNATDTDSISGSCSTPVTVAAADQSISFAALPNVMYGAPDTVLSASVASGLPVTFSATGNCTIVSGAVHGTGSGSCAVTANQVGNGNYNAAPPITQTFNIAQHPLTVTAQDATRQYGAANPSFSGTISGIVNSDAITATYSSSATPTSAVGTYAIVPVAAGAALSNYSVSLVNGKLTVTAGPATQLTTSAVAGTLVSGGNLGVVTATIEDANGNTAITSTAPVTVTITGPNGYSHTASSAAVNGVATLNLAPLTLATAGTYTVTTSSPGLTGTTSMVNVTAGAATQVTLGALSTSITSGQNLGSAPTTIKDQNGNTATSFSGPITATITGPNGFSQTVTGTVVNGVINLDLGPITPTDGGTYTLTVSGAGLTPAAATITVANASQTIPIPALPNVTFGVAATALPSTSSAGLPVSYVVTGPAVLTGSSLTVTGVGAVTVTASQPGDSSHNPVSTTESFTVAPAASTTALTTSSGVAAIGTPVVLTAQVTSVANVSSGTITFLDGLAVMATVPVSSTGSATFTLSTLPTGTLSLTALYSGSANFLSSTSDPQITSVQDFGVAAKDGSPSQPVVPGAAASFQIDLTPGLSGYADPITLTATGLPPGATYSFSPATVTPGSATVSTVLTVQTAKPIATASEAEGAAVVTFALLLLPLAWSRKGRRIRKGLSVLSVCGVLLLLGSMAGLSGCGTSNGFFGQPAQSYVITVTATSGTISHATTVVLNVQ